MVISNHQIWACLLPGTIIWILGHFSCSLGQTFREKKIFFLARKFFFQEQKKKLILRRAHRHKPRIPPPMLVKRCQLPNRGHDDEKPADNHGDAPSN